MTFSTQSFNVLSGSSGFKINVLGHVLVDENVLFALDNNGVRDNVTPDGPQGDRGRIRQQKIFGGSFDRIFTA